MISTSPLDPHRDLVLQLVHQNRSLSEIVRDVCDETGVQTSERSLRRALRRWDHTPDNARGYTKIVGDNAEVGSAVSADLSDPDALLRERHLDPEEWAITSLTVNEWDSPTGEVLKQLKVNCSRKKPYNFLMPAVEGPSYRRSPRPVYKWDNARLGVFVGDQQAPYLDERLHDQFCQWTERNQPDLGVLMGDGMDLPDISRHPENPEWHVAVQASVNSCYSCYRDYVQANEDCEWFKLMGNHDERIRVRLLQYLTRLYELRPASKDGEEQPRVWDTRNLLHLDELGIKLIEPDGNYTHAQYQVSPQLAARHGWVAKKGSGASALATLEALGYSVLVGHTHRQAIVHKTMHDIDGQPRTHVAIETGCMCRIEGGLGYAVAPDWQNGFATAVIWPDGRFKPELATYVGGSLHWRDQRFS